MALRDGEIGQQVGHCLGRHRWSAVGLSHLMRLLKDWRDEAVRADDRIYTASDGRRHEKSLSGTCLTCHWEKEEFCDRCHDYIGVTPYCWNCHVDPM